MFIEETLLWSPMINGRAERLDISAAVRILFLSLGGSHIFAFALGELQKKTVKTVKQIQRIISAKEEFAILRPALFGLRNFLSGGHLLAQLEHNLTDELHRKDMAADASFVRGTNAILVRFQQ